jgi:hypothetical protein
MSANLHSVARELDEWLLGRYLPIWVAIGNGGRDDTAAILEYWGAPMHAVAPGKTGWLMTPDAVLDLLAHIHTRLRAGGYTHTDVLDKDITVYCEDAASIEALWSRCRADGSEIEREAVHFNVHRTAAGWRVVSLVGVQTSAERLHEVWRRDR